MLQKVLFFSNVHIRVYYTFSMYLNPFLPPNFPVELEQRNFVGFLVFGPVFQKKKILQIGPLVREIQISAVNDRCGSAENERLAEKVRNYSDFKFPACKHVHINPYSNKTCFRSCYSDPDPYPDPYLLRTGSGYGSGAGSRQNIL